MKKDLLLIFLIPLFGYAQKGQYQTQLQGTLLTKYFVKDSLNTSIDTVRIPNQTVELYDFTNKKSIKAFTNIDGKFFFDNIQTGFYKLVIDDPLLKKKKYVTVNVRYEGKSNFIKPLVIDRVNQDLKIKN